MDPTSSPSGGQTGISSLSREHSAGHPSGGPLSVDAGAVEVEPRGTAVLYLRVSTARQPTKNNEAEGYSIPAQREACSRKAHELGADVIEEFVDAGASARSADRPSLNAMLTYLEHTRPTYVIVHKVDRRARDRADDVMIALAIRQAGAILVSATEQIDSTPSGKLLHGIMASIAEFYSANLATEASKGMAKKAEHGGTHGLAPIGYRNTLARIDGHEVRSVEFDPDREAR